MSDRPPINHPSSESELIELIRSIDVPAPAGLHRRTEALIAAHASGAARGAAPLRARLGAAGALVAAAVVVLALVLSSGGSSQPSAAGAAALTLRSATLAPPAESSRSRRELAAAVDGVSFPYWRELGWRSTGARADSLAGHAVTTVFYAAGNRRVGYAILAGHAPHIDGGMIHWRDGTPYRLLVEHGGHVVVWLRSGHLCVLGGRGVSAATLLRLASWDDRHTSAT